MPVTEANMDALELAAMSFARRRIAVTMREQGYTYEAIGRALGVSAQYIHKIMKE